MSLSLVLAKESSSQSRPTRRAANRWALAKVIMLSQREIRRQNAADNFGKGKYRLWQIHQLF